MRNQREEEIVGENGPERGIGKHWIRKGGRRGPRLMELKRN